MDSQAHPSMFDFEDPCNRFVGVSVGFFVIYVSELDSSAFCEAAADEAFLAANLSFRVAYFCRFKGDGT